MKKCGSISGGGGVAGALPEVGGGWERGRMTGFRSTTSHFSRFSSESPRSTCEGAACSGIHTVSQLHWCDPICVSVLTQPTYAYTKSWSLLNCSRMPLLKWRRFTDTSSLL